MSGNNTKRDKVIKEVFNCDVLRFEQAYQTMAYEGSVLEDLSRSAKVLADLVQNEKTAIEYYLGYLPDKVSPFVSSRFCVALLIKKMRELCLRRNIRKWLKNHVRLIMGTISKVINFKQALSVTMIRKFGKPLPITVRALSSGYELK